MSLLTARTAAARPPFRALQGPYLVQPGVFSAGRSRRGAAGSPPTAGTRHGPTDDRPACPDRRRAGRAAALGPAGQERPPARRDPPPAGRPGHGPLLARPARLPD